MIEYFKGKYYRQIAYLALWCYRQLDKRLGERRPHLEKAIEARFLSLNELTYAQLKNSQFSTYHNYPAREVKDA